MDPSINYALINKQIVYPGTKYVELVSGTRVKFHYQTRKADGSNKLLDDSKSLGKPMELVLGKKFKLEVWEVMVQKMSVNEVAKFTVDKSVNCLFLFKTLLSEVNCKQNHVFLVSGPVSFHL